jgi:hypothetical protein
MIISQGINGKTYQQNTGLLIRYFDNYLTALKGDTNAKYSDCAWLDIDDPESYFANIKVSANKFRQKFSGLRIYFGKYKQSDIYDDLTVILSPTIALNKNTPGTADDHDMAVEAENYRAVAWPPKKIYLHH